MTITENFSKCDIGIYRIFWKSGGSSRAAVGLDYDGNRWIAPTNWTCPRGGNPTAMIEKYVDDIEKMEKLA